MKNNEKNHVFKMSSFNNYRVIPSVNYQPALQKEAIQLQKMKECAGKKITMIFSFKSADLDPHTNFTPIRAG